MKMIDPTAMSRFSASWSGRPTKAGIPPPWRWNFPRRWWFSIPPSGRRCPSCSLPATPCRRTRRSAVSASPSPFPGCGSRRTRNKPPLRFRKAVLRQAPRVACALHFRCAAPPHGSLPFCGGGPANNWHAHRHGHGLHSKRPHACQWAHGCARCFLIMQVSCAPIVRGWLHLHGIHFKSHMDGGRPFVSAPPLSVLHGMLMPNATHTRNQLCSKKHGPG